MPRKGSNRGGRKNNSGAEKALSAGFKALEADAATTRKQAARASKLAAGLYKKAHAADMGAEAVHLTVKRTEAKVHDAERRSGRKPLASEPALIVGVGASAGGYEAFARLLERVPQNTGMAFVLVQHLAPDYDSRLTELLGHSTSMPVLRIKDHTVVEANRVYVIPPNRSLVVAGGELRLNPRRKSSEASLPVDEFFISLAADQGSRAVGVILSGNGTDGTQGMMHIKAEGGITFAQDEKSAKYASMPASAIQAGCVDFVLPPAAIAKELERIARQSPLERLKAAARFEVGSAEKETDLGQIFNLLRGLTGVDFSAYKLSTLKRRITRRMQLKRLKTLGEYFHYLQQNTGELELLFNDILINVTSFFRDPSAFAALKKKVFPKLAKLSSSGAPIRIWVPGCSTGEEVYSLAIALHEFLGRNANAKSMQIFGTDLSEGMVNRARMGVYPKSIASQVSPERLRRYFTRTERGYQISKFIRDLCIFAKQNVAEDPPFSKVDLISCRNLLIYLGPMLQKKVIPVFHYSLQPGGFLMLGSSETIGTFNHLFALLDKKNKVYCKLESHSRLDMEFATSPAIEAAEKQLGQARAALPQIDLQRRADEILLSQYTPGGVVVNSRMEVLHFRGKTGYYLEPAPGTASLNLLKMVREELVVDIRTAFAQATKSNAPVRKEPVRIRYNGHYREVTVEVVPFKGAPSAERFFLVLFHDVLGVMEVEKGKPKAETVHQHAQREIRRLREEIAQTKESLQSIIEEQEATNEELKSANEEIQSSNEELQSTNEELETAKEELQSANEELTTLNEELQNRNAELIQANNDLNNLLASFNMPILMLGNDLTIRRFTPLAESLFNLIPGDVGRRITDINANLSVKDLDKVVAEVIENLNTREVEVQDKEGRWFSLRVRPYRTSENNIDGAVLVLVDIGDLRNAIDEITEIARQPMLILNSDLKVAKANDAFAKICDASSTELEGRFIFEAANSYWNAPAFKTLLERILPDNKRVDHYRLEHPSKNKPRTFVLSARRLYQQSKGTHYIVISFEEVMA